MVYFFNVSGGHSREGPPPPLPPPPEFHSFTTENKKSAPVPGAGYARRRKKSPALVELGARAWVNTVR